MKRNEIDVTVAVVRERERESREIKKNCLLFDVQKAELKEYINEGTGYRKKQEIANFTDSYNEKSKEMRCESKNAEEDFFRDVDVVARKEKTFTENSPSFLCALKNIELASERGITLLALILTVVIMIILAAVTINVTLGDGGLIDQAQHAAEVTVNSTKSEQEQLDDLVSQLNEIIGGSGGTGGGETNTTPGEDTNQIEETNTIDPEPEPPEPPEPLPDGTISIGEPDWQDDGTANVTVSTTEPDVTIEYQIGGTDEDSWIPVEDGMIEGIENGETVYVRITDGEQSSNPQETTVQDTTAPEKANIEVTPTSLIVGESLTATVTHIDNETGVDTSASKWVMNQSAAEIGTDDISAYTGTFDANTDTITLDSNTAGEYYLHVLTVDKAGNKTETVSSAITISSITGTVTQNGQVTWSAGQATLVLQTTESQYTIVYKINGQGEWQTYNGTSITGLSHGDTVTACLTNASQTTYGPEAEFEIKDETDPTVTVTAQGSPSTNSITVTAQASDNESGMVASPTYTFQYKTSGAGSYTTPSGASNISNATYTFTGLTQGTTYDIQVIVNGDVAGNTGTGLEQATTETVPGADEGLQTGTIIASPVTWSGGKASTTLTTNTSFKIQYQINTVNEESWSEAADSPVTVSNLDHGNTVYARLTDGVNAGDYAAINIVDGIAPTVSVEVGEVTDSTIKVTVTASDGQSGLASSNAYKYYLNSELSPRATSSNNTYTYTGLTGGTDYNIKVEVVDKGNNIGTGTATATTKKTTIADIVGGADFTNNTPIEDDLGNIVIIPGGFGVAEDSGTKVEEGIVIEDGDGNQFVWIPTGTYRVSISINSSGQLTNNLSRRTFTSTQATEVSGDSVVESYYYGEGDSRSVASGQIGAFKASAESTANGGNGGFYIGRYEQGIGNAVKAGIEPYADIDRDNAKNQAETMYTGNSHVVSELMSSYAWDTALNFICQTNKANGEGYNLAVTEDSNYGNIGGERTLTGEYESDEYSNIYDFIGNCQEWTTEYSTDEFIRRTECVSRGADYYFLKDRSASSRQSSSTSNAYGYISFRTQIYVK